MVKVYNSNIFILFQPDLIKSLGYPVEEHFVQSQDGYIVTMHRIPHGYNNTHVDENKPRPVVLLGHCMMASSVVFTFGPTNQSLAYLLADEGTYFLLFTLILN
jgi:lysosomal acid lipase/cholesteryl ester hydrolase